MSPQRTPARATRAASRCVGALTVLSLLAPPAGALTPLRPDAEPHRFAPATWPGAAASDAFVRDRASLRSGNAQADASGPRFQAPSASNCRREVRTHEELGSQAGRTPSGLVIGRTARTRGAPAGAPAGGSAVAEAPSLAAPAVAAPEAATPARAEARADAAAGGAPLSAPTMAPAPAGEPAAAPAPSPAAPGVASALKRPQASASSVTAGMVDDNANFAEYLAYRDRTQVQHRAIDVRQRVLLQVRDTRGNAVPDAEVVVRSSSGAAMWARTDTAGRAWIAPDAFDRQDSRFYEVTARHGKAQSSAVFQRGQKSAVDVTLKAAAPTQRARLDLVFLIDATGSMADEIAKLKTTLRTIADDVAALPSRPDTCFSLVAYRDKGDAFVLRSHDFTSDLGAFQKVLDQLQAAGGGDTPEAMNEALFEAVHALSWRGNGATRLMVLLADAPPHLDYDGPQYDETMMAALGKGIKVFSVGASGLDPQGEYIQRQIAQYTGGRFVFLTYRHAQNPASGPGRETVHDVSNYSVETLDRLIVRLVTDELARLPKSKT